ncbi:MAG TPA: hypothetical protein VJL89_08175 [Thermodesulfovibrionia bacterium]|nr:hypothetical protein [Thermodesulfovibrionia bacterium]
MIEPRQELIAKERIQDMITLRPRRVKLSTEWPELLHEPKGYHSDWSLVVPFCETIGNAFESMCDIPHIGIREGREGRCYTFINDEKKLDKVREWLGLVGGYVAIRDCLALSFALDYDRADGNPDKPQTKIGLLRSRAKPYDSEPTEDTHLAAEELSKACIEFFQKMTCYHSATCVVAMPPSKPDKLFDLPKYLADEIAKHISLPNLSIAVRTTKERAQLKGESLVNKLPTIEGTISVDASALKGQNVLFIVDPLVKTKKQAVFSGSYNLPLF